VRVINAKQARDLLRHRREQLLSRDPARNKRRDPPQRRFDPVLQRPII
jgi:hypothetical protein